jgi:hypothetical protein
MIRRYATPRLCPRPRTVPLRRVSRYNVKVDLELIDRFMLIPGSGHSARFAVNGELFAQMSLDKKVSEDTTEGRLVLYNVNTVYLVPCCSTASSSSTTAQQLRVGLYRRMLAGL